MRYDPSQFSYGLELEFGDVERSLKIPEPLGSWEYAETDIVNLRPPYQYVAVDPLGIDPPVGGEINTVPTIGWQGQLQKFTELLAWFRKNRQEPTVCCLSELHVHVHVPGLTEDINALKDLTVYTVDNQKDAIRLCGRYDEKLLKGSKVSRAYLKLDMGRTMPEWMGENILKAKDFEDFIRLQCCGKDGVSRGRPIRYAINTYCLKHTQTVEFRLWRSTLDPDRVRDCLRFAGDYLNSALNGGPSVNLIVSMNHLEFPPFRYSQEECVGWEATKWDKSRGKKTRRYVRAGL